MGTQPERGFKLDFSSQATGHLHDFCGPHDIAGADCPNCERPLLRILSLDAADTRLGVAPDSTRHVHLLYCWTCSIPYGVFRYRLRHDGSVELLQVPPTSDYQFGPEGPYDGYSGQYPLQRVGLIPLSETEHHAQIAAQSDADLALDLPIQHQIGGFPFIANPEEIICPVCSQESPLLARSATTSPESSRTKLRPKTPSPATPASR